ncbi:matrix metalloproteinase 1-like isoform X2, partial [Dinothrombium tinctorium]
QFLANFGYMKENEVRKINSIDPNKVKAIISKFQRFMGIPETDSTTMAMMNKPRCGNPDIEPIKRIKKGLRRGKRYVLQGSEWSHTDLTWNVKIYSQSSSIRGKRKEIDEVFRRAFEIWSKPTSLRFIHSPKSNDVDISIKFITGDHGDRRPFDGPGNTLAHAFYPEFGGDAHFDDTEDWTFNSDEEGSDLLSVAVHEFGHSLGLRHSDVLDSIMYPAYTGLINLTSDDIAGVTMLYPPKPGKNEEDIQKNKNRLLTTDLENNEEDEIDVSVNFLGYIPVFIFHTLGNNVFYIPTKAKLSVRKPIPISTAFPRLTGSVDAAVTDMNGRTYIFKGSGVWIYLKAFELPIAENQPISSVFQGLNVSNIDAALQWSKNGKLYFFKDDKYWRYEHSKNPPIPHEYPKSISAIWKGLSQLPLDAAFQWTQNRKSYFFKDDVYWRFNDNITAVEHNIKAPFPRLISQWWFSCGNATVTARLGRGFLPNRPYYPRYYSKVQ